MFKLLREDKKKLNLGIFQIIIFLEGNFLKSVYNSSRKLIKKITMTAAPVWELNHNYHWNFLDYQQLQQFGI